MNGRKVRRGAHSQNAVEDLLDELRAKRDDGTAPQGQTVGDHVEAWLRDSASSRERLSTLQGCERKIRGYVIPAVGRAKLERLTPQHVHHAAELRSPGRHLREPWISRRGESEAALMLLSVVKRARGEAGSGRARGRRSA